MLVTGRVLDQDGRAVPGALVLSRHHSGGLDTLFTGVFVLASLGTACLVGLCDDGSVRGTTGTDGRFRLRLPTAVSGFTGGDQDLQVVTGTRDDSPDGATLEQYFYGAQPQALGDVHVWLARPSVSRAGAQVRIGFRPLPDSFGDDVSYAATATTPDGQAAVGLGGVRPGATVDGRLVERGLDGVLVSATGHEPSGNYVVYTGRPSPVAAGPVPVSRGRGCSGYGPGDRAIVLQPCRVTDGVLSDTRPPSDFRLGSLSCQAQKRCSANNSALLVPLGSSRTVRAVVLHGCSFDCTVAVSTDGRAFRQVAATSSGHDPDVLLTFAPTTARFVRVHFGFSLDLGTVREISVF